MKRLEHLFVSNLHGLNILRILSSRETRTAKFLHCRTAGRIGRLLFSSKIRFIPDHAFTPFNGTSFTDQRYRSIMEMTASTFAREENKYLRRTFEQNMALSVYEGVGLIMDQEVLSNSLAGPACILLPLTSFDEILTHRYGTSDRHISWCFGEARLRRALKTFAPYCIKFGLALWRWLTFLPTAGVGKGIVPREQFAICVPNHRGGQDIGLRHDLFWLGSETHWYPTVLEYATPNYPLAGDFLDALKSRNVRVVESHLKGKAVAMSERWVPGEIFLKGTLRSLLTFMRDIPHLLRSTKLLSWWKALQRLRFNLQVSERKDFYEYYNIKAELITGFTLEEPVHTYALSQLGGISCSLQYSTWIDPFGNHTSTSTLHLYFGDYVQRLNLPFSADVNILNGYIFKTPLCNAVSHVNRIKTALRAAGARRSVGFLDEGFMLPALGKMALQFYEYLFERIIQEDDFGVVIKPKKNYCLEILQDKLGKVYGKALATGRLVILNWDYYPGIIGQCVDLTVGILGTAPLESAIMGGRTIYLNPLGHIPSYLAEERDTIFDSVDDAVKAVESCLGDGAKSRIGHHSQAFLQSVDHYRDDEVSARIEYLLMTYLAELSDGKRPNDALTKTLRGFSSKWNASFI